MKKNGKAEIEYYTKDGMVFSSHLIDIKPLEIEKPVTQEHDTMWVMANASYRYEASHFRRQLLGDNYRTEWAMKLRR